MAGTSPAMTNLMLFEADAARGCAAGIKRENGFVIEIRGIIFT
jgi:hypothetical protein